MRRRTVLAAALTARHVRGKKAAAAAAASAHTAPPVDKPEVTGTVTHRERVALPPNASLKIVLEDVSRIDAPAATVTEQTRMLGAAPAPYSFVLAYDPGLIAPNHSYAVRAEIRDPEGALKFTTSLRYPVITQGAPKQVEIQLDAVS